MGISGNNSICRNNSCNRYNCFLVCEFCFNMIRKDLLDLAKVVDVLNKHKIHFWMYGGALAGYVKIKDMFPWDGDIDLFIWQEDYKKLMSIRKEFGMKYIIKGICLALRSKTGKNIDIMPYTRDDKKGVAYQIRAQVRGRMSKILFFGPVQKLLDREMYKSAKVFWHLTFLFGAHKIRQEVPLKYYDNLKEIDFFGIKLKVPEKHEEYLDYTFGYYWRKPIEEQEKGDDLDRMKYCDPNYWVDLSVKRERPKAFFPGKFQPPHIGHVVILSRILKSYDVILGITEDGPRNTTPKEVKETFQEIFGDRIEYCLLKGVLSEYTDKSKLPDFDVLLTGNEKIIDWAKKLNIPTRWFPRIFFVGGSGTAWRKTYG